MKSAQWQGQPKGVVWNAVCQASAAQVIQPKILATVNGIPVGHLEFDLQVVTLGFDSTDLDWKRARARAYRKAFISYARADFERVSYYAEMIDCTGIELLFDLTSLEPGDDWADWIKTSIPGADVFFLMWSKHAAASVWVDRESRLAMRTNTRQGNPDVKPILLERPTPEPPKYMRHLHFSTKYVNQRIAERNPLFT